MKIHCSVSVIRGITSLTTTATPLYKSSGNQRWHFMIGVTCQRLNETTFIRSARTYREVSFIVFTPDALSAPVFPPRSAHDRGWNPRAHRDQRNDIIDQLEFRRGERTGFFFKSTFAERTPRTNWFSSCSRIVDYREPSSGHLGCEKIYVAAALLSL